MPALPEEWPAGSVKSLIARGEFEVDMEWNTGKPVHVGIRSRLGGPLHLRYDGKTRTYSTRKGERIDLPPPNPE